MSAPHDDETLMLHADGELSADEARDVERALAASPELRRKADALAQLGEVMRARTAAAVDDADARLEAVWGKIAAEIASPAARSRPARGRAAEPLRAFFRGARGHAVTAVFAAAAGALLATLFQGGDAARPDRPAALAASAAEVESLEVPEGSAMVFQIPGEHAHEAPTTVIWITDEMEQGEGPI
jgi:anti-sigma factor RsiW